MKKSLLFILLAFMACNKSDDEVKVEKSFEIVLNSPELDFFGVAKKSLTNIQVKDMIKVKLEITKLKGADIISVNPISRPTSFHELLNTDYELYIENPEAKETFVKTNTLMLKLGINTFYVKPLVPGTFQISLEESTKTYEIVAPIVFSAVKIDTRIEGAIDNNCGFSKWRRHKYWFSIDDGNQTFDMFLNEQRATYSYETVYRGAAKSGSFTSGPEYKIIDDVSDCGDYPSVDNNIVSITITKHLAGNKQIVTTYYDIPIY